MKKEERLAEIRSINMITPYYIYYYQPLLSIEKKYLIKWREIKNEENN
jgi:hypothetical protein